MVLAAFEAAVENGITGLCAHGFRLLEEGEALFF